MARLLKYIPLTIFLFTIILCLGAKNATAQYAKTDTIKTAAVIYEGDTLEAQMLADVQLYCRYTAAQRRALDAWTKLRTAIYITYPYAKNAAAIINDVNLHLATIKDESARKAYIKSREIEIKKNFEAPITNLTVYQGKILMKLINRETGNNCYELIKEYKGGLTARVYQTVAFFFDSDLKQPYDANGDDAAMEVIVKQVARMYGYKS
jgi:uncharacterized protein DUF4294